MAAQTALLLALNAICLLLALAATPSQGQEQRVVPPYERGKDKYKWLLTEAERERGLTYYGSAERLRAKMKDLLDGKKIKITTIGGSITGGQGAADAPNWSQYVFNWFDDHFPGQTVNHIGAVGGTMSTYMVVCHNIHIPRDTDVIFVEYTINDHQAPMPHFQNDERKGMERLVRRLLQYPKRPAVVFMHAFQWHKPVPFNGAFWNNAERELGELALYYGMPELSLKGCCYHNMLNNVPGFNIKQLRNQNMEGTKDIVFYHDPIHPDGRTGARAMAEMAIHLLVKGMVDLKVRAFKPEEQAYIDAPLPAPMIPGNLESKSDKCFIGNHFVDAVKTKDGFEWINESKTPRPKWGMVATKAGSRLTIKVDTRGADGTAQAMAQDVLLELAYLKSYENMGQAEIKCDSGCVCKPTSINGHHTARESQLNLHNFYASQSEECLVSVTVKTETESGGNKVKLAGIMVSEQAGQSDGIRNNMAVEYVHDISMRAKDGTFELRNHARRLV